MKSREHFLMAILCLMLCQTLPAQFPDPLTHWRVVATPGHSIRGMAYKDGMFVAVGYSTNTAVSTNGTNWFQGNYGITNPGLLAVAEGAGQFVAVGRGLILHSTNGLQWTRRQPEGLDEYWAVTYGGGQFVAVGFIYRPVDLSSTTVALTSPDGIQWQRFVLPFNTTPRNIVYGNGVYVAPGGTLSIMSTNGRDWAPLNSISAQSVAFGGGQFVATVMNTAHGTFRSSNGVDWTEVTLPGSPEINFYTAGYANGTFVLAGQCSCPELTPATPMMTSTNGIHWTLRTFTNGLFPVIIRDMVFVDGELYVGSDQSGRIWKSGRMNPSAAPVITDVTRHDEATTLSFTSLPGFRYTVERANQVETNAWNPWRGPIFATTDQMTVTDFTSNAMQFYRVQTH